MLTAICSFPLRPDLSRERAICEMRETLPVYQGRAGLIRKYVCIDPEAGRGCGIYLWTDRPSADAYFAEALPFMRKQLGTDPEVAFFDTPMIVDNSTGEVHMEA